MDGSKAHSSAQGLTWKFLLISYNSNLSCNNGGIGVSVNSTSESYNKVDMKRSHQAFLSGQSDCGCARHAQQSGVWRKFKGHYLDKMPLWRDKFGNVHCRIPWKKPRLLPLITIEMLHESRSARCNQKHHEPLVQEPHSDCKQLPSALAVHLDNGA